MALVKRITKGSSLTYAEMDANFTHLGGDGSYQFPATDGSANQVLGTDGNGQLSFVTGGGGGIALTDLSVGTEASASGDGGIGYDNTTGIFTYTPPDLSSYRTTVAFCDLTGKPTTISGYGITDAFDGAASSLTGNIDLASQVTGILPVGNMAATALTTVQTASSQSAHLALTAQEGDVVVRTDENKTYMHNGGSAGTMADYTLLATPTDAVTSVDGNTGAVTTLQLGTSSTTALAGNTTFAFADITSKPTTIAGYGITDALELGTSSTTALAGNTTFAFADITSKPTTISGYGITDALQLGTSSTTALAGDTTFAFADITSKPTTISGYGITDALQLGTSSTTALAGDTTFAFADITSKPTTISGYGITDALQLGTSSTTALAGDTTFAFADITSKPTTIAGYGITDALELTDFSATTNTYPGSAGSVTYDNTTGVFTYQPQYNLYGPNVATAQDIGLAGQTGNLNVGISTASHTVNIAGGNTSGAATNTVNIASAGSVGSTQTVNIARMNATGVTTNVLMGNAGTSATSNITITGNTTINNGLSSNTITIGGTTQTGTITLGQSTQTQTINIGAGATASTKIKAINIGTGGATGSVRTVNIGSGNISGSTTSVYIGNSSATASSTVLVQGDLSVDRPLYGNGAPEYYDFFDHLGGITSSGSDGDWDISGTGLNALTEITIPARASFTGSKRGSLRMSCQVAIYNSSSSTKRTAEYYLGLQMKSKGTSVQSENLGVGTFVSSPSSYSGVWSFAGNVTDKIVAGFGQLGNNSSASGMTYGGAQILGVWYDDSTNKTYIRISSYYYYNNLGGSAVSVGNSTSFDVYYNPTDFQASGTWVSSLRADSYNSRVRYTVQPQSTHSMNHAFNLSVPKETTKTELRLIFDYQSSNTNLSASVYAIEGTVMLEGSRV